MNVDDTRILVDRTSDLPNSIPTLDGDVLSAGDDSAWNVITNPAEGMPTAADPDPNINHTFKGAHRHRTGITKQELVKQWSAK